LEIFGAERLSCTKSRQILHVFAPKFFWGKASEILNLNYLIKHTFHHRAKFRGDRPTELEDFATEKNKCQQNISPLRNLSFWAAVFEMLGGCGTEPPNCFLNPLTHCQIVFWGVSYILYT